MHVDEKEATAPVEPTLPVSEPLTPLADARKPGDDEDDPDAIFLRAVSEIATQPLPKYTRKQRERAERHFIICIFLFVLSLLASSIIAIILYPNVTIELVPLSKHAVFTTQLSISTRTFAPVTLSKSLRAPTTGHGHQDATRAVGTVTFYNGLFTTQTIPIGTVFTGSDGVKVTTDEIVTLPAANPPQFAETTVTAHTLQPGAAENIQAGDINTTVSNGVLVKNTSAFHGGRDARDYTAVAQADIDILTGQLQQQLTQALPHQFLLRSGEALVTTNCMFKATSNQKIGEEAREVTVNASKTCEGITYSQDDLQQKATAAFTTTRPGTSYQLVGSVQTSIVNLTPFTVSLRGLWVYHVSQDYEQFLAEKIAGDTPQEAKSYLLKTGVISHATIRQTQNLPDPYHIQFQIVVSL